jgi:hypothetical protein
MLHNVWAYTLASKLFGWIGFWISILASSPSSFPHTLRVLQSEGDCYTVCMAFQLCTGCRNHLQIDKASIKPKSPPLARLHLAVFVSHFGIQSLKYFGDWRFKIKIAVRIFLHHWPVPYVKQGHGRTHRGATHVSRRERYRGGKDPTPTFMYHLSCPCWASPSCINPARRDCPDQANLSCWR